MSLPQNVITVTMVLPRRVYRPHGITVKVYRGYRGITAFPLPCHRLVWLVQYYICSRETIATPSVRFMVRIKDTLTPTNLFLLCWQRPSAKTHSAFKAPACGGQVIGYPTTHGGWPG